MAFLRQYCLTLLLEIAIGEIRSASQRELAPEPATTRCAAGAEDQGQDWADMVHVLRGCRWLFGPYRLAVTLCYACQWHGWQNPFFHYVPCRLRIPNQ